jgi:hypothetical protein
MHACSRWLLASDQTPVLPLRWRGRQLLWRVPVSRVFLFAWLLVLNVCGVDAERIGLTALRRERPELTGAGVPVAQPEGPEAPNAWQVNPSINTGPAFTWNSANGTATSFPNALGVGSTHATAVGSILFGTGTGIAPGVPSVDSYEAWFFITNVVYSLQPTTPARVVNQSFYSDLASTDLYNAFAVRKNIFIASGMNNAPDTPHAPATAHNVVGVGMVPGTSSIGPTIDGRAKPDIVAPHGATSYSTPMVAGAAALLIQAADANAGGPGTAALATNIAVLKALLLNGAVKPPFWTNGPTRPLDARYGSGVLHIYNSDLQLRGGRHTAVATNSVITGNPHPPVNTTRNLSSPRGWDLSEITSSNLIDRVAHYFVQLSNAPSYSATITLTWLKGAGDPANLDLYLFNATTGALITNSISGVDNVEHIFVPNLPAGRYDVQVLKRDLPQPGTETYALAFDFSPASLQAVRTGNSLVLSWPSSPAGFALESTTSLSGSPTWQPFGTPQLTNQNFVVQLPLNQAARYFRLRRQ